VLVGTFRQAWAYVKLSWSVLAKDTGILIFPILSTCATLLVLVPFVVANRVAFEAAKGTHGMLSPSLYAQIFLLYLACSFIIVFSNSAMVACASICLSGGTPKVADGFAAACRNLPRIVVWSIIAGTVGFLLALVKRRDDGIINQIVASIIGVAWTVATFFIIPVIILENCDIFAAFKRSADLFRRQWGTTVVGNVGLSAFFVPFWIAPLVLVILGQRVGVLPWAALLPFFVVCGIYYVILGLVQSALEEIFVVVAYQHASGTGNPQDVDPQFVTTAFSRQEIRISN